MKKYLYTILLSLISLISLSQSSGSITLNKLDYNTWYQCENSGYGLGSFYLIVSTTNTISSDNNFYYDIYFSNNSFYSNGELSSSYIEDINFYTYENGIWTKVYHLEYLLVNNPQYALYIYDNHQIFKIKITWGNVYPY